MPAANLATNLPTYNLEAEAALRADPPDSLADLQSSADPNSELGDEWPCGRPDQGWLGTVEDGG